MKTSGLLLALFILCCSTETESPKVLWEKHEAEFEQIVYLLKTDKLRKVYGRGGYEIPDSFRVRKAVGRIVFRETDFTYDNSNSILFRIGFDTSRRVRGYPTIVYTDNAERLASYNSRPEQADKLKQYWYLLTRQ